MLLLTKENFLLKFYISCRAPEIKEMTDGLAASTTRHHAGKACTSALFSLWARAVLQGMKHFGKLQSTFTGFRVQAHISCARQLLL